jgi:ATP-binding cassette subfamily F protein 2
MARDKKKRGGNAPKNAKEEVKEEVVDGENGEEHTNGDSTPKQSTKQKEEENPRSATGVLSSQYLSRDLKLYNFSLTLNGIVLIQDTELEFNWGRRYGLLGLNGTGKSTMLTTLAKREVPIPDHFHIYFLDREVEASEKTAFEAVVEDLEKERAELEKEAEELVAT